MTPILVESFSRLSVSNNSDYLYIFTDNLNRSSGREEVSRRSQYFRNWHDDQYYLFHPSVTQACIRGLDNAFPITTMLDQYKHQLTMEHYDMMERVYDLEVKYILLELVNHNFKGIKLSSKQFGNGQFSRVIDSPELFKLLCKKLLALGIDNTTNPITVFDIAI